MFEPNKGTRDNATLDICLGCMEPRSAEPVCSRCGWSHNSSAVSVLHLAPGTVLHDCYLVGRVLGQGGFGITYLGWDMALSRKIAIKEYFPQTLASRQAGHTLVVPHSSQSLQDYQHGLRGFLEEGRILARFSQHPCIVPVLSLFEANGTGYLVMGYIEGITLAQYLAKEGGRIPYARAYEIMLRVMDGLREVHGQGLLHRDISPDNIYLSLAGTVKILDFGAARFAALDRSQSLSIVLKPGYAPEEQYRRNGKQGPWTDVYATAATFYRCITGSTPPEALERLVEDTLQPPGKLGVDVPPKAEEALLRALTVRADGRFESMEAFQKSLAGEVVPPTQPFSWVAPEPTRLAQASTEALDRSAAPSGFGKKKLLVGIGAALLIGVVTLVGMNLKKSTPPAKTDPSVNTLRVPDPAVPQQPAPPTPSPAPVVVQPSQNEEAQKQLELVEAQKRKAQADAEEAARKQQQAEAAAARAKAAEQAAAERARADEQAAAARAAAEAAAEQERARLKQEQDLALQRQREEEQRRLQEAERQREAAARNPDWVFSVDNKTYKIQIGNGFLTISPSSGTLSAQLPIKTNKKGKTEIMGQWQSGGLSGFLLIQAVNDNFISGYMLFPQIQGANCTTRTGAFMDGLSRGMNHEVEGCRQVNVSWHKQ